MAQLSVIAQNKGALNFVSTNVQRFLIAAIKQMDNTNVDFTGFSALSLSIYFIYPDGLNTVVCEPTIVGNADGTVNVNPTLNQLTNILDYQGKSLVWRLVGTPTAADDPQLFAYGTATVAP